MDVKALSKSKRAHSLHHTKKRHPQSPAKAPQVVSDDKTLTGKQAKEKLPRALESRPLPSNWDRYDDASGLASEEAPSSSAPPSEMVAPKSKGADYAYLISEAKEARTHKTSFPHPFVDDITYDYGPMLLSRGQSILSWVEDDNFELDGEGSSSFQIPFLTLNLDALAKQLARTKPSTRWFIEPDGFPSELLDDELQAGAEVKYDDETLKNEVKHDSSARDPTNYSSSLQFETSPVGTSSKETIMDSKGSGETATHKPISRKMEHAAAEKPSSCVEAVTAEAELDLLLNSLSETKIMDLKGSGETAAHKPGSRQMEHAAPGFEAVTAEAELDMLLNSFSETKISGSPTSAPARIVPNLIETTKKKETTPAFNDADVDKLLQETSGSTATEEEPSSRGSVPRSQVMEDFDSWLDSI